MSLIIDTHGHYTTSPPGVDAYRGQQIQQMGSPSKGKMNVTDDQIRESIETGEAGRSCWSIGPARERPDPATITERNERGRRTFGRCGSCVQTLR